MEFALGQPWNPCSVCRGIGARFAVESAFGLAWNTHSVADQAANDSAILLLDPRLVVLLVCTRPRKLGTRRFAEVAHRLVHKGAIVVGI
ncbi:hypothetical protein FSB08_39875 [Paraburkholderia sp. JPY432]|nr:hypothetical protein [Paraburkholderia youngii]